MEYSEVLERILKMLSSIQFVLVIIAFLLLVAVCFLSGSLYMKIESTHDKTKSTTDSPTAPDQSEEKKAPALLFDETKQYFDKKKQPPFLCLSCPHMEVGTKEGDCVYAGFCCYGTTADEDLPPF